MIKVKKCPEECKFDWKKFHRELDIAFAHFIEESPLGVHGFSDKPIMELLEFSNQKQQLQGDEFGPWVSEAKK
jgi:hypothetical protein